MVDLGESATTDAKALQEIFNEYADDPGEDDAESSDAVAVNKALLLRCFEFGDFVPAARMYNSRDGLVIDRLA